jgi:hypothetical protein
MALVEGGEHARDVGRERRDRADRDTPAQQAGELVDGAAHRLGGRDRRAGVDEHGGADLGRADGPRAAVEERVAELGLEALDLGADARLGDVQALGRAGEASLVGDRDEIAQLAQLHNGSC